MERTRLNAKEKTVSLWYILTILSLVILLHYCRQKRSFSFVNFWFIYYFVCALACVEVVHQPSGGTQSVHESVVRTESRRYLAFGGSTFLGKLDENGL